MFDTLGFLWLHHDSSQYLLEKLVDGLSEERTRPLLLYKKSRLVSINHSTWNQQLLRMCAMVISKVKHYGAWKCKLLQTGPKFVYTAEQWEALVMMAIVEGKCPIAQRDGL